MIESRIGFLKAEEIVGLNDQELEAMAVEDFWNFPAACLTVFSEAKLNALGRSKRIALLRPENQTQLKDFDQIGSWDKQDIEALKSLECLGTAGLSKVTAPQISFITPLQIKNDRVELFIKALDSQEKVSALMIEQIKACREDQILALSPQQLQMFSVAQLQAISENVIRRISVNCIEALSPLQKLALVRSYGDFKKFYGTGSVLENFISRDLRGKTLEALKSIEYLGNNCKMLDAEQLFSLRADQLQISLSAFSTHKSLSPEKPRHSASLSEYLGPQQISFLNPGALVNIDRIFKSLMGPEFLGELKNSQIENLPSSWFWSLDESQIAYFNSQRRGVLSETQKIALMPRADLTNLSADDINALSVDHLRSIRLDLLETHHFRGMDRRAIQAFTSDQLNRVGPMLFDRFDSNVQYLTVEQIKELGGHRKLHITDAVLPYFLPEQIAAINLQNIRNLPCIPGNCSISQVAALTLEQIGILSIEQIVSFTDVQLKSLGALEFGAIRSYMKRALQSLENDKRHYGHTIETKQQTIDLLVGKLKILKVIDSDNDAAICSTNINDICTKGQEIYDQKIHKGKIKSLVAEVCAISLALCGMAAMHFSSKSLQDSALHSGKASLGSTLLFGLSILILALALSACIVIPLLSSVKYFEAKDLKENYLNNCSELKKTYEETILPQQQNARNQYFLERCNEKILILDSIVAEREAILGS